ncbi:lauroyl-Kdo(2)-lipid IV(A) myristoyltransferase [Marinomonas colpomeniae]|uniref:Lipid A biosynthesis acyltransferase n=1 Tax=Marinomonas colpomeniae TaxID=2774408 RepID=A0ABR8NYF5_9GAMM|nr:lauroyl-Kdo(2)-lipid IV(A) myristoyltransferase [Marinomonas colpomeniae]MBD5770650.1 lauroyl-Kdo(2)-lipid IV(A) myristoyltransferase [Marinomonas colpomeniae]
MSLQDKNLHNPKFTWSFLAPKFWLTWLLMMFAFILAYVPFRLRDKLAKKIVPFVINKKSSALKRARLNLQHCFPNKSLEERDVMLRDSLGTAIQFCFAYGELFVRSEKYKKNRNEVIGGENLFPLLDRGENVITLVPHCWAIDYTGSMLASLGYTITTIMKPQKNPLMDWIMHSQRMQYGRGVVYPRSAGVKPFLQSVKKGYVGYYLPDEDLGAQHSVFVPFLGAEKATMKGLGKLTKLTKAHIVPMFQAYNDKTGKYELHIFPALENFPTGDDTQDAILMNQALEAMIEKHTEQYMWILNLLRSQPDGNNLY